MGKGQKVGEGACPTLDSDADHLLASQVFSYYASSLLYISFLKCCSTD
jgi:hypothetical protein